MIPCKNCITLPACRNKKEVDCQAIMDYTDTGIKWKFAFIDRQIFKFKVHYLQKYLPNINRLWGRTREVDGLRLKIYLEIKKKEREGHVLLSIPKNVQLTSPKRKGNK